MKLKFLIVVALLVNASACAFFDQPLDDFGSSTLPPPNSKTPAAAPPLPSDNAPSGSEPMSGSAAVQPAPQPTAEAQSLTAQNTDNTSGTFFTVATLFDVPDNTPNISFVHFTKSGGSSDATRALAICKALLKSYDVTAATDIPANANHLVVWPVIEDVADANCSEMLDNYDPIEIGASTAEKVKDSATGPFLLTRNTTTDKRLVFDFSNARARALSAGLKDWQALVSGPAQAWPDYESAN